MKFISAGHCNVKGPNYDPGAVGNGRIEAVETARIRNRVIDLLQGWGYKDIVRDDDDESLSQYLKRIKPGNASIVCEFHFNAASDPSATGVEVLIGNDADRLEKICAAEFAAETAKDLEIKNRGVKTEAQSHRGRLGLMREQGVVILVEVCFISNPSDMASFDNRFDLLCKTYAELLAKWDDVIK